LACVGEQGFVVALLDEHGSITRAERVAVDPMPPAGARRTFTANQRWFLFETGDGGLWGIDLGAAAWSAQELSSPLGGVAGRSSLVKLGANQRVLQQRSDTLRLVELTNPDEPQSFLVANDIQLREPGNCEPLEFNLNPSNWCGLASADSPFVTSADGLSLLLTSGSGEVHAIDLAPNGTSPDQVTPHRVEHVTAICSPSGCRHVIEFAP
jgi:hypothetical protein